MNDMSMVIVPKSDQINADDLLAGPRTITITKVVIKPGTEQPVSIFFDGEAKAYRPCKSMARVMVAQWGPDANAYVGRSMTLYCDPKVQWGGMAVGGIRISHMSHIEREAVMALTATKGSKKAFVVKPLAAPARTAAQPPTEDKEPKRVQTLVGRINAAADKAALDGVMLTQNTQDYRAWLRENRPELEAQIVAASGAAYAKFLPPPEDDGWPGPDVTQTDSAARS